MRRKLRKLMSFSLNDCLTLLYVYTLFLLVELGFHIFSFSTMTRLISLKCGRSATVSEKKARRDSYLVAVASKYNVFRVTCLKRAFVLFRLLKKGGSLPTLCIGVQKDEGFAAHAWVEIKGSPVLDSETGTAVFKRIFELT